MNSYEFSLVLTGVDINTPYLEDILFEAGCDDGLVCFYGTSVYIEFEREATDFKSALISAIKDIESSKLTARVMSVDAGDYVGLSDISELTDISKQSIALLKDGKRGPGTFPTPVLRLQGRQPLWRWGDVAQWLSTNNKIDPILAENAKLIEAFNMALEMRKPQKRIDILNIADELTFN